MKKEAHGLILKPIVFRFLSRVFAFAIAIIIAVASMLVILPDVASSAEPGHAGLLESAAEGKQAYLTVSGLRIDRGSGSVSPQGDASLAGAIYGIYMNEDMTHPDGDVLSKNQLVGTAATDTDGNFRFDKLSPARYYLKEISPSEGYLPDENIYEVDEAAGNPETDMECEAIVSAQVAKQPFELRKIGARPEESAADMLKAGFKAYLISGLSKVRSGETKPVGGVWAASDFEKYDFAAESPVAIDGIEAPGFFTDESGCLLSPELPYGTYVVVETAVPAGRAQIRPFIVRVAEDSRTAQPWRIFGEKGLSFFLKITKKDRKTGKTILGKDAAYRIYDIGNERWVGMKATDPDTALCGTEDNPFHTGDDGYVITPEKLPCGKYRIVEVEAPKGYVKTGDEVSLPEGPAKASAAVPSPAPDLIVDLDGYTPVYAGDENEMTLVAEQYNEQKFGRVAITVTESREVSGGGLNNPISTVVRTPVEGAEFRLTAETDISSQDGSGVAVYPAGAVACELVTDGEGKAETSDLPPGDYVLSETKAADGYLPAPDRKISITLEDEKAFGLITLSIDNKALMINGEDETTDSSAASKTVHGDNMLYEAYDNVRTEAIAPEAGGEPPHSSKSGDMKRPAIFVALLTAAITCFLPLVRQHIRTMERKRRRRVRRIEA
ncbi:MAG: hypothetical protein LBK04_04230 [Clostridiales Family XIII bacterium]|nr:hypothetical protein [Clostridiales Family XIII bacterium]